MHLETFKILLSISFVLSNLHSCNIFSSLNIEYKEESVLDVDTLK